MRYLVCQTSMRIWELTIENFNRETIVEFERILDSDAPEMAKLVQAFDWTTRRMIQVAQNEIELAKAMQDQTAMVKTRLRPTPCDWRGTCSRAATSA